MTDQPYGPASLSVSFLYIKKKKHKKPHSNQTLPPTTTQIKKTVVGWVFTIKNCEYLSTLMVLLVILLKNCEESLLCYF